jgi:hypothetical protein
MHEWSPGNFLIFQCTQFSEGTYLALPLVTLRDTQEMSAVLPGYFECATHVLERRYKGVTRVLYLRSLNFAAFLGTGILRITLVALSLLEKLPLTLISNSTRDVPVRVCREVLLCYCKKLGNVENAAFEAYKSRTYRVLSLQESHGKANSRSV